MMACDAALMQADTALSGVRYITAAVNWLRGCKIGDRICR
jgi:hypothetical protein